MTLHTGQTAGAHAIEVDHPMTRGDFMIRLAKYFGWPHYNAVMDDGTDINDKGEVMTTERVRNFYDAVSYTHLDVYKRQPQSSGPAAPLPDTPLRSGCMLRSRSGRRTTECRAPAPDPRRPLEAAARQ